MSNRRVNQHLTRLAYLVAAAVACPRDAMALTVHAAVLSSEQDAFLAESVRRLLEGSGIYEVITPESFPVRLGDAEAGLWEKCVADANWEEVLAHSSLDQIILVDRLDSRTIGLRVYDAGEHGVRMDQAPLRSGSVDLHLLERLFFSTGSLKFTSAFPTRVVLDGWRAELVSGELEMTPVPAGKHSIEVSAPGYLPEFHPILVRPGEALVVDVRLDPAPAVAQRRLPWGALLATTLLVGGGAVVVASVHAPLAIHP